MSAHRWIVLAGAIVVAISAWRESGVWRAASRLSALRTRPAGIARPTWMTGSWQPAVAPVAASVGRAVTLLMSGRIPTDAVPVADRVVGACAGLLGAGLFGAIVVTPGSALLGGLCAAGAFGASKGVWSASLQRAARREDAAVSTILDQFAVAVRGGQSPAQALAAAAVAAPPRLAGELAHVVRSPWRGELLSTALDEWAQREQSHTIRSFASGVALAIEQGGSMGTALEGVACSVRDRAAVAAERQALASQAQASMAVMVLLPPFVGIVIVGGDPAAQDFLLRSSAGNMCLLAGLTLDAAGAWWIRRWVRGR